jgi:hypothetical protein
MERRFEELLSESRENGLSPAEQQELLAFLKAAEENRRAAAQDRLVDRWLAESRNPTLDANAVLRAVSDGLPDLAARTMAEIEERAMLTRPASQFQTGVGSFWAGPSKASSRTGMLLTAVLSRILLIFFSFWKPLRWRGALAFSSGAVLLITTGLWLFPFTSDMARLELGPRSRAQLERNGLEQLPRTG